MEEKKPIKDIGDHNTEFKKLTERFNLLHNRLLAIAMDYNFYLKNDINDRAIYDLRDNIAYRLYSSCFHFQLLLEHHSRIEYRLQKLYKEDSSEFFNEGFKFQILHEDSTKEVYSLFDSMIYHLCSIFDYLCQIINYSHGVEKLVNPKWNVLLQKKNLEKYLYCSKELIPVLQKLDSNFIYPLIGHRSQLIHTSKDTGGFNLNFDMKGTEFKVAFFATQQFKKYFPDIEKENEGHELTIKFASLWLFDKTIKTATEILFELSEDMKRNRKTQTGFMMAHLNEDNTLSSPSVGYWGDKNVN